MIEFTGQAVIVTGAGRGLGRLYAIELARRGASVVVNDLGGSMHGDGADASVADQVVEEIQRAGGVAVASHDSVDSPRGRKRDRRTRRSSRFGRLDAVVSNAGIFSSVPFDELSPDDWRRMLARAPRRRVLLEPARIPRDEVTGLRPIRLHFLVSRDVRPAAGGPLRRGQGRPRRADERHRDRRRRTRHPAPTLCCPSAFRGWSPKPSATRRPLRRPAF